MSDYKPISILGIISYKVFPPQMGGQNSISEFYAHLASYAMITLVVSKDNELVDQHPSTRLPIIYNHWWGILNFRYLLKLRNLIKQKKIDFIFIEHSYFGWLGYILRFLTKKPFVLRSHNIEALRFQSLKKAWWRIYAGYEKFIHRQADYNFFVTEEDRLWAINRWKLDNQNCYTATYGTSIKLPMKREEKMKLNEQLKLKFGLSFNTRLFIFNGTLDYLPNLDAIKIIIGEITPVLKMMNLDYRILICGNRLPKEWEDALLTTTNIIYLGYVDSISPYLYGADCFINPVTLGGGIKTKLIDALSHNLTSISTNSGAQGINLDLTQKKLILVNDLDWVEFAKAMAELDMKDEIETPDAFYKHFNWNTIVKKALLYLQEK